MPAQQQQQQQQQQQVDFGSFFEEPNQTHTHTQLMT